MFIPPTESRDVWNLGKGALELSCWHITGRHLFKTLYADFPFIWPHLYVPLASSESLMVYMCSVYLSMHEFSHTHTCTKS